ncbi:MAG TPA: cysteine--tRNA ligase [Candidatus Saccharimonadales bacterium]|nr:cysteine--tRNA ligase [Candidatus Saccharimonadales bacterium]
MLKLYNTLTRSIEEFKPLDPQKVTMYSCGPTVYDYQHIGHMRRYVGDDVLARVLKLNGFIVKRVMNITDVGHLVSDSDEGEDKMEKGARKFGMSVWKIAKMFEKQFVESCESLLIEKPNILMHATDYIKEQIDLIRVLEEKGFTYQISDGIYFDTSKFPEYTKLSRQKEDALKAGARVEMTEGKKQATDFALWKFSYPNGRSFDSAQDDAAKRRQMEWESPWGIGFPGWHIECSAMSLEGLFKAFTDGKLLQDKVRTIDIHTGGIDHIAIHHTNEIAQAEAATDKKFVDYWVHHNFLQVNGEKMSKSLGNFYTVQDVIDKGFDPMALRYLYLQTHYRQEMNFTWESLEAAEKGLQRLRGEIAKLSKDATFPPHLNPLPHGEEKNEFQEKFLDAVNDDMNMAKALAVVWELMKSDFSDKEKTNSVIAMDNVLGLELFKKDQLRTTYKIPEEVKKLVEQREVFRKQKDFKKSDELRDEISERGYEIKDTPSGPQITAIKK